MLNDREQAEAYLRQRNQARMEGLPPEIIQALADRPAHFVAEWLDTWGEQHRRQAQGPVQPQLNADQHDIARKMGISDDEYIAAAKLTNPQMYEDIMANRQPSGSQASISLTDEQRSIARLMNVTDEEYIEALKKLGLT